MWKNKENQVIYVGKAKNLFNRMHQYFQGRLNSYKTSKLVSKITSYDFFVCSSENEALILEKSLIKNYNPKYNILLKDDKNYSYIKVEIKNDKFLNISFIYIDKKNKLQIFKDQKKQKHLWYYGPFAKGLEKKAIVKILNLEFVNQNFYNGKSNLNLENESLKNFQKIKKILTLKDPKFIKEIAKKEIFFAQNFDFENSLIYKKALDFFEEVKNQQVIELKKITNIDVWWADEISNKILITKLVYRSGSLISKFDYWIFLQNNLLVDFENFLENHYQNNLVPKTVILDVKFLDIKINSIFSKEISFHIAKKGIYKKLLDAARENNQIQLENLNNKIKQNKIFFETLKPYFKNETKLEKIDSFIILDNSFENFQYPVSGFDYYFQMQKINKFSKYYRLKNNQKNDADFFPESLALAFKILKNFCKEKIDFIIVDGGKNQINKANFFIEKNFTKKIPVIGLVKNNQHKTSKLINFLGQEKPIENQMLLQFFSKIQEEIDSKVKIFYQKKVQDKLVQTELKNLSGIGPFYQRKLLDYFKTFKNIFAASKTEISKVLGQKKGQKIYEQITKIKQ